MIPELKEQFEGNGTYVRYAVKWLKDEGIVQSFPGPITRLSRLNEAEDTDVLMVYTH